MPKGAANPTPFYGYRRLKIGYKIGHRKKGRAFDGKERLVSSPKTTKPCDFSQGFVKYPQGEESEDRMLFL
jgi:hypothetical protein